MVDTQPLCFLASPTLCRYQKAQNTEFTGAIQHYMGKGGGEDVPTWTSATPPPVLGVQSVSEQYEGINITNSALREFTDFPSLCACSESSLTNLIGSGLNLLCLLRCLLSHSIGQRSRFLVLTKRSAASGDENEKMVINSCPIYTKWRIHIAL